MDPKEIAERRLANQRLVGEPCATPEEVVRHLGAVQAQELPLAKWSLARRADGASGGAGAGAVTEAAVDRAFAAGVLLRTHLLRPTWHFVLPADLRWMMELTAPRVKARMAYYDKQLGLGEDLFARSQTVLDRELGRRGALTRKEVGAALGDAGIVVDGMRLGHLLMRAELDLLICSGAPRGRHQTYALVAERAPGAPALPRDEALAELARRYFISHGPATLRDFMWWSSLSAVDAKRGVEMLGGELEARALDGSTYWMAPPAERRGRPGAAEPIAHLLQGYDEFIVAYTESKSILFPAGGAPAPGLGGAFRGEVPFLNAVVLDGRVVGHWRRGASTGDGTIEAYFTRPLNRARRRALAAELERYCRFLEQPVRIQEVATMRRAQLARQAKRAAASGTKQKTKRKGRTRTRTRTRTGPRSRR